MQALFYMKWEGYSTGAVATAFIRVIRENLRLIFFLKLETI